MQVLQEELETLGCSYQNLLDAVQVLHSRCFFQPETSCHMAGECWLGEFAMSATWSLFVCAQLHSSILTLAPYEKSHTCDMTPRLMTVRRHTL